MTVCTLRNGTLALAGLALAFGMATAQPASAQTATNLNCNGCVGKKDLGDSAVRSNKIKDGNVKAKDLTVGAQPGYANNIYNNGSVSTGTGGTVTALEMPISLPNKANIVATATWQFGLNDNEGADCAIRLNSTAYSDTFSNGGHASDVSGLDEYALAATGVFIDANPGLHTVRLVCRADSGDNVTVRKRSLTLVTVPKVLQITGP